MKKSKQQALCTVADAMIELGEGRDVVMRLIAKGELDAHQVLQRWVITVASVAAVKIARRERRARGQDATAAAV